MVLTEVDFDDLAEVYVVDGVPRGHVMGVVQGTGQYEHAVIVGEELAVYQPVVVIACEHIKQRGGNDWAFKTL